LAQALRKAGAHLDPETFRDWTQDLLLECWRRRHAPHIVKFVPYYTYCISSNNSAIVLSYQWLPTSIQRGEAMARRRKEDGRVGSASRGMVRRWGRFFSRVRPRGVPGRERGPARCRASGAAVDLCRDAPA